jgi:hypothetical protein
MRSAGWWSFATCSPIRAAIRRGSSDSLSGYVATALPLPGGGSGGIEAALAFSLHAVGVPLAPALLGVLVYRFFHLLAPDPPGTRAVSDRRELE